MILVTVGTQLPFDRLIRMMDEIAPTLSVPVYAQVGSATYQPRNMQWSELLQPVEFDRLLTEATLIVSHAGIGTVLMAQKHHKPAILVPRRANLGEHRNDHQLATASALGGRRGVYIAQDADELTALLTTTLTPSTDQVEAGRDQLRHMISGFIRDHSPR